MGEYFYWSLAVIGSVGGVILGAVLVGGLVLMVLALRFSKEAHDG